MEISDEDNCTSLFIKMGDAALRLALRALPKFLNNELVGVPQDESLVTFSPSIKPEEEKIDLSSGVKMAFGKIRALSDVPGAYLFINGEKLKVFKSFIISNEVHGEVNTVVSADKRGLYIQLNDGVLSLLEVQKEGKKRMDYKSFLNGSPNLVGSKVE